MSDAFDFQKDFIEKIPKILRCRKWAVVNIEKWNFILPKVPCVYAFVFDGELSYVGATRNMRSRFQAHKIRPWDCSVWTKTRWGQFRDFEFFYLPERVLGESAMFEIQMIQALAPKFNKKVR
jgi:hypothetical protein